MAAAIEIDGATESQPGEPQTGTKLGTDQKVTQWELVARLVQSTTEPGVESIDSFGDAQTVSSDDDFESVTERLASTVVAN